MRIVCRDERYPHLLVQLEKSGVDLDLFVNIVSLNFQIEVLSEDILVFLNGLLCSGYPFPLDQVWDLAAYARRKTNEPLAVLTQNLLIDSGRVVESFQIARRHQLDQILVSRLVFNEQNEVIRPALHPACRLLAESTLNRAIDLTADDRFNIDILHRPVKIDCAEQVAVIRHRYSRHLPLGRPVGDRLNLAGAVKQAVFRMAMEVDKVRR